MPARLLADENIPAKAIEALRVAGLDVLSIREHAPGISDEEVLRLAVAQDRVLVTFDRDYGELIFAREAPVPPAVIYLRLASYRPEEPGHLLIEMLESSSQFHGYFVVVEKDVWRKRPLPQR